MVIGSNQRPSRPTGLQPGDTAMHDVRGQIIKLTADGLLIDAAGLPVVIQNAASVHIKGDLIVDGEVTMLNATSALNASAIRSTFNGHAHSGVQSGTSNSGDPTSTL